MEKKGLICAMVAILLASAAGAQEQSGREAFGVGHRVYNFEYEVGEGWLGDEKTITLWTAIWYPTDTQAKPYIYRMGYYNFQTRLALDAPVAKRKEPYPLVIFVTGAHGSALGCAYFMEHLAAHGYVVAAADYIDYLPPDFKREAYLGRIRYKEGMAQGKVLRLLAVLPETKRLVEWLNTDMEGGLRWFTAGRIKPTSFIVDKALEMNRDADSPLFGTIDAHNLGIVGYSAGGVTVTGLIGAHPDAGARDARIKAALIFSGSVYQPFQEDLSRVNVPLMLMVGDRDPPAINPTVPRRGVYDRVNPPKYYLVLRYANHFSFGNPPAARARRATRPIARVPRLQRRAICSRGLAFFQKYLKNDPSADAVLGRISPLWTYYEKEESRGQVERWGVEPKPGEPRRRIPPESIEVERLDPERKKRIPVGR